MSMILVVSSQPLILHMHDWLFKNQANYIESFPPYFITFSKVLKHTRVKFQFGHINLMSFVFVRNCSSVPTIRKFSGFAYTDTPLSKEDFREKCVNDVRNILSVITIIICLAKIRCINQGISPSTLWDLFKKLVSDYFYGV